MTKTPEPEKDQIATKRRLQRNRKIRLAQTAPAGAQRKDKKEERQTDKRPKTEIVTTGSNLRLQRSKTTVETPNRRKSLYLQIGGTGRKANYNDSDDSDEDDYKRIDLPKPSPRAMLDVMIGLNAFSHVPPPRCVTKSPDINIDNRNLVNRSTSINSLYDSTENIAGKFVQQWRSRVASRRESIIEKLADVNYNAPKNSTPRWIEPSFLASVPELERHIPLDESRKSNWNSSNSKPGFIKQAYFPGIGVRDEAERRELFQAWVKERKDELVSYERPDSEKLNPKQKDESRRKSFMKFLKDRKVAKQKQLEENEEEIIVPLFKDPYEIDDGPQEIGDMMKTIMNIKKRFKDPIDSRVKKFYKELDEIKERDAKAQGPITDKGLKRRWKMLMKGVDAALADSSDEEDNYFHTI